MYGSEESKFINSTDVSYLDTSKIRREDFETPLHISVYIKRDDFTFISHIRTVKSRILTDGVYSSQLVTGAERW